MTFEVIRAGAVVMRTGIEGGGYTQDILRGMAGAGYIFRLNGRPWISEPDSPPREDGSGQLTFL